MNRRVVLGSVLFALGAGAIAFGVLTDAREARLQSLLAEIESAEERVPHAGTRYVGGPESGVVLRVGCADGRRWVEFVEFTGVAKSAPRPKLARIPYFGGVPVFLRPGHGQWKRRVKDYDLAFRNYDVEIAGRTTVAGRAADVIEARPRRAGRAGYRVAADAETRLPLRFEVLQGDAQVFLAEFRDVSYSVTPPARGFEGRPWPKWLKITPEEHSASEIAAHADYPVWVPARPPEGFELRRSEVVRVEINLPEESRRAMRAFLPFPIPDLDARVAHFDYTDGFAVVSVVECPAKSDLWALVRRFIPDYAPRRMGEKVVAQRFSERGSSAYVLELGDTVALVAGNLPPDEMESMIRTFERR
jgi:hypothetical protein